MSPITIFPEEKVLLQIGSESLVEVSKTCFCHKGQRMLVAVTPEHKIDYPLVIRQSDSVRVLYDCPEWFTNEFRRHVRNLIIAQNLESIGRD